MTEERRHSLSTCRLLGCNKTGCGAPASTQSPQAKLVTQNNVKNLPSDLIKIVEALGGEQFDDKTTVAKDLAVALGQQVETPSDAEEQTKETLNAVKRCTASFGPERVRIVAKTKTPELAATLREVWGKSIAKLPFAAPAIPLGPKAVLLSIPPRHAKLVGNAINVLFNKNPGDVLFLRYDLKTVRFSAMLPLTIEPTDEMIDKSKVAFGALGKFAEVNVNNSNWFIANVTVEKTADRLPDVVEVETSTYKLKFMSQSLRNQETNRRRNSFRPSIQQNRKRQLESGDGNENNKKSKSTSIDDDNASTN
mgnify:FL=1